MIKLEVCDITFNGAKPKGFILHDVVHIITSRFREHNIRASLKVSGDTMFFQILECHKLFESAIENGVKLKADDERIKKMGRDYLKTERLTEEQENSMWKDCINGTLTSLGLAATIKLYEHYDEDRESHIVLRERYTYKEWPLKSKTYPTKL